MKPHQRLQLLDRMLREKKFPNLQKVNNALIADGEKPLSERQFFRDIDELKNLIENRYPNEEESLLKFNRFKGGYEYKAGHTAFSDFSRQEIKNLADLAEELKNHKHLFLGSKNLSIYEKIKALAIEDSFEKGNEQINWSPVSLIKEGERKGQEYFDELILHIKNKTPIEILYRRLGEESRLHHCLPLLIKEYNSGWYTGWYLLAIPLSNKINFYLANTEDLIVYAMDRIEKIIPSKIKPKVKFEKKFNPEQYFKNVFGIIRYNLGRTGLIKAYKVEIETTEENWIYDYILKYPIHSSQKIIKNEQKNRYLKFYVEIEIDKEIENYLYNHSSELRVLKPKFLRETIINRLNNALENY